MTKSSLRINTCKKCKAAREENVIIHLHSIYAMILSVWIWCSQLCPIFAYYKVRMSNRFENQPGLSAEFRQRRFSVQMGSRDPFVSRVNWSMSFPAGDFPFSAIIFFFCFWSCTGQTSPQNPENISSLKTYFSIFLLMELDSNYQSWHSNCWWHKGIQLATAVTKHNFPTEFRSTALLCGMIHYTNSNSKHAVQFSQINNCVQWWPPLWEHWCMNGSVQWPWVMTI